MTDQFFPKGFDSQRLGGICFGMDDKISSVKAAGHIGAVSAAYIGTTQKSTRSGKIGVVVGIEVSEPPLPYAEYAVLKRDDGSTEKVPISELAAP
jgi:hypothetical protein